MAKRRKDRDTKEHPDPAQKKRRVGHPTHGVLESTAEAKPLAGRAVLVTGAARRIGRQIALAMARAGADVAITYRTSEGEAEHTTAQLAELGGRVLGVRCDVRDVLNVHEMVQEVVSQLGRLDILVNNAAVYE